MKSLPKIALLCLWALAGCSLLVTPDEHPVRCATGAVCPTGTECISGVCSRAQVDVDSGCVPREERCDGQDNDCDSIVDEGHDADMDGVTWCGAGIPSAADCDDTNASVFPESSEVCDGIDNDCDGSSDEGPEGICGMLEICSEGSCFALTDCRITGCVDDFVCDTTTSPATCVDPTCSSDADCELTDPGTRCDPSGTCVEPRPIGSPCTSDAGCEASVCEPGEALSKAAEFAGRRFCTTPCCGDTNCPAGTICAGMDTGAHLCVPPALLSGGATLSAAGESCTTDNQCLSGTCIASKCAQACASDSLCESGSACALWLPFDSSRESIPYVRWACQAPSGSGSQNARCEDSTGCRSGMCLSGSCREACRSGQDCSVASGCVHTKFTISYFTAAGTRTMANPGPAIPMCVPIEGFGGSLTSGAACSSASECRDRFCRSGVCVDTCCSGLGAGSCPVGYACRVIPDEPARGTYTMGCIR